jgi:hypothetical protein
MPNPAGRVMSAYRRLSANAGLHLAITGADVPDDDQLLAATAAHNVLVGSLRYCYQVTDPVPGLLVGFGALPTSQVGPRAKPSDPRWFKLSARVATDSNRTTALSDRTVSPWTCCEQNRACGTTSHAGFRDRAGRS